MIETRNIFKSFGPLAVLKGVNFRVKKGEILAIVGASGAGKTTFLQILGTLDKPDSGEIIFNDTDIALMGKKELAKFRNQHIGFVFQFHNLLPEFTALENVCIPGFIGKRQKKQVQEKATSLLQHLGLNDRLHHKPSELSGGEQQRVAVARALINDPDLILADEPSGNLDSQNARDLYDLFKVLRNDFQQTFVIVTHNEEFAHLADRTIKMKDGIIVK
ncbi:MAG: ABC transporter ATP-binding protein [Crocinitomicaceae bacterium]|nr:ABC transporter ATP-binding protein [Crocinitomicaceae bacterium]MBT5402362.1 ABC transporter ATP-binding protein [Crocinitomicaceae bacterium]MBT6513941.1 ABC transporter ATP-binding protein [Crocinitomicaceae bacterium]MDG2331229.1 ABC transporter ATP-binding protein [Flavobacteriales bacterium]